MNGLVRGSVLVGDDEARIAEVVASYLVLGLRLGTGDHAGRVLVAATVLLRRLCAKIERHPARPRHGQTACGAGHRLPP
jgi:hypothetical protein